jgi:hypothetical protein
MSITQSSIDVFIFFQKKIEKEKGTCPIKLFTDVIYRFVRVFDPGKPFQPSTMFAGRARGIPYSGVPERCFTRVGWSKNIRPA